MTRPSAAAELAAYLRNSPDLRISDIGAMAAPVTVVTPLPPPPLVAQSIMLPVPPSANRYWRTYRGRTVVSADAKAYKAGVWLVAQAAGMHPFACPVAVRLHVYRARKAGDLDNYAKVTLDALRGIAYQDDNQIIELHLWRHDDKANPRIEVEIREVTP